jgi:hypothetical protein
MTKGVLLSVVAALSVGPQEYYLSIFLSVVMGEVV